MKRKGRIRLAILLAVLSLAGCIDSEAPLVVDTSRLSDTRDSRGPYEVLATARDNRGVVEVKLHWGLLRDSSRGPETTAAAMTDIGAGRYRGEIPGAPAGTVIVYFVEAQDLDFNLGRDPADGFYQFAILPVETADGGA